MCRWLAYAGPPIYLDSLILKPKRSLITQSRAAQQSLSSINADGFGIGWYGDKETPGVYRDILPAWNDTNLKSLAAQVRSGLFFGHVRATTGTPVIKVNCHPFTYGRYLFMHNGVIGGFSKVRRALTMAIAPELFPELQGTTDSEVFFLLLLTRGLENDPETAFAQTVALVETEMKAAGVTDHFAMTAAVSDGETIYALRYASDPYAPSLYYAIGVHPLDNLGVPAVEADQACLIVSEPLDEVEDQWHEVPPSHMLIAGSGGIGVFPFEPGT
ncbi:MAG: class II glutamine amidotransferase [Rhodospirillaceae bacterium]|jgi:predicted glutamine amidotransferase|nr:class II glutamine amidotransferase [Rhodospirillaceae bacterium]